MFSGVTLTAHDLSGDKVLATVEIAGSACSLHHVRGGSYEIAFPGWNEFRVLLVTPRHDSRPKPIDLEIRTCGTAGSNQMKLVQIVSSEHEVEFPQPVCVFTPTTPANPKHTFTVDRVFMRSCMQEIRRTAGGWPQFAIHYSPKARRFQVCWGPAVHQPVVFELPPSPKVRARRCTRTDGDESSEHSSSSSDDEESLRRQRGRFQNTCVLTPEAIQTADDDSAIISAVVKSIPHPRVFHCSLLLESILVKILETGEVCYVYRYGGSAGSITFY